MCVSTANPENVLLFWMKRKDDENSLVTRKTILVNNFTFTVLNSR